MKQKKRRSPTRYHLGWIIKRVSNGHYRATKGRDGIITSRKLVKVIREINRAEDPGIRYFYENPDTGETQTVLFTDASVDDEFVRLLIRETLLIEPLNLRREG